MCAPILATHMHMLIVTANRARGHFTYTCGNRVIKVTAGGRDTLADTIHTLTPMHSPLKSRPHYVNFLNTALALLGIFVEASKNKICKILHN